MTNAQHTLLKHPRAQQPITAPEPDEKSASLHLFHTDHYALVRSLNGYDVVNRHSGKRLRAGLSHEKAVREAQDLEAKYERTTRSTPSDFIDLSFS